MTGEWSWDDALRGVIPPMISPLDATYQVDTAAVHRMVNHILDGGCSGLFVLGGVGEGAWLSSSQRLDIITSTVHAARGRAPVLAGLMLPGTAPACDAAQLAVDAGADALVVGSPYYFGVDAASQVRHVEAILAATTLPVLLYNIPQCTHAPLAHEAIEALASEPRILGVKDSWGDLTYFQSLLSLKHTRASFRILQGHEHAAAPSLLLGGDGLIPGLANIAPRLLVELVQAARVRDLENVHRLHMQVFDLTSIYTGEIGLPGLYAASSLLGLASNIPAQPWAAIADSDRLDAITETLRRHALLPAGV
jgi:4-hydroxy-tetrahydrodipicolinate synthase